MKLKPVPGRAVRIPEKGTLLHVEGAEVQLNAFWRRRLRDGDVVEVTLDQSGTGATTATTASDSSTTDSTATTTDSDSSTTDSADTTTTSDSSTTDSTDTASADTTTDTEASS